MHWRTASFHLLNCSHNPVPPSLSEVLPETIRQRQWQVSTWRHCMILHIIRTPPYGLRHLDFPRQWWCCSDDEGCVDWCRFCAAAAEFTVNPNHRYSGMRRLMSVLCCCCWVHRSIPTIDTRTASVIVPVIESRHRRRTRCCVRGRSNIDDTPMSFLVISISSSVLLYILTSAVTTTIVFLRPPMLVPFPPFLGTYDRDQHHRICYGVPFNSTSPPSSSTYYSTFITIEITTMLPNWTTNKLYGTGTIRGRIDMIWVAIAMSFIVLLVRVDLFLWHIVWSIIESLSSHPLQTIDSILMSIMLSCNSVIWYCCVCLLIFKLIVG
jgi:hypothetical protein